MDVVDFNLEDFKKVIGERTYYLIDEGRYQLNETLLINEPNVTLIGIGKVILVKASKADGVYVDEEGEGFKMVNIKIVDNANGNNDNLPPDGPLGNADDDGCCLVVKASNTRIEYCYFDRRNCNYQKFAVFYPGPDHGQEGLPTAFDIHFNVKGELHTGNVFRNNIIRSRISCDNLSFSLQKDGTVENNNIEGMIAVYMCRHVTVHRNYIEGITDGRPLYITLPAEGINISENELITVADNHLIKIAKPVDTENDSDWGKFEQRINYHIHININGSRYKTTEDMLYQIDYPFLNNLTEDVRRGRIFVVDEAEDRKKITEIQKEVEYKQIPIQCENMFVDLLNDPNHRDILTRINN